MATCKDCKNYDDCNKNRKCKIEIYSNGWLQETRLCDYVDIICREFLRE